MIHFYRIALFILSILCVGIVCGQGTALTVDLGIGKVIKHKEELLFDIPTVSTSLSLVHARTLSGEKQWHSYWGMPELTWTAQATFFGDKDVLGQAYSLMPGIKYHLIDKNRLQWSLSAKCGIGYLTAVYDRIENPLNNAVSSHWNNSTSFGTQVSWHIYPQWSLSTGFELIHFSNGRTKSPNSGINVRTVNLSITHRLRASNNATLVSKSSDVVHMGDHDKLPRRIGALIQVGMGRSQVRDVPGGPTYSVFTTDVLGYWQFATCQRLLLGPSYEYNDALYNYQLRLFTSQADAKAAAKDLSLVLGDELQFGTFAARVLLGYYLNAPSEHLGEDFYFKLGAFYKPSFLSYHGLQATMGIQMKSHFAIAEYIALYIGCEF